MRCVICKNGDTQPGASTVTLTRDQTTVIIKDVPSDICDTCGEYYLSADISRRVMQMAQTAVDHGAELEILRYAA